MALGRTRAERIDAARTMFAADVPKRRIARDLGVAPVTVRHWLGTAKKPASRKRREPEPADVLLEAALAWYMRFDLAPNSVSWNATKARKKGSAAWGRHLEGWGPRGTTAWRSWPQPHDVTRRLGSWRAFHELLDEELERRRADGAPYVPRTVPSKRSRFAILATHARDVIGKPRDASEGDPLPPAFPSTRAGLVDLRGRGSREGVAIVGDPGTRRSNLLAGVVELDRLLCPPVVLVQRADKPLIAVGLPNSDLIDLDDAIRLGCGAIVRSDEPDVRWMAIARSAQASASLGRDVRIAVDDADDLLASLAHFMVYRPPTAHLAVVWTPQLMEYDTFVWAALPSRTITDIADPAMNEILRRGVDPTLLRRLGLPRQA